MSTPLLAAGYGVLAAFGLILGAIVGLWLRPAHRVVAAVMAFGSGTLLSAVAFDLCEEAFHKGGALIVVAGFLAGGAVFVMAEAAIDSKGGFLRREGTRDVFLKEKKAERASDILARLSEVPLVQALPPAEVQAIVPYVEERAFGDGEVIFHKGDAGDALYLLVDGEVRLTDEDRVVATLAKGAAFGEMALLTGEPRNATVTAAGPVRVYRIARDDFNHLMAHSRDLAQGVQHLLEERIEARATQGDPEAAQTWRRVASTHLDRSLSAREEKALLEEHAGSSAPVAIFLGALVDGVPESLVIGATMIGTAAPSLSFLVAVFISNFPEAMSSATGMTKAGFKGGRIMGMWSGLVVLSGLAAFLGNALLATAPHTVLGFAESFAGGGILALLANTMMPEAFELGGRIVAFLTITGFLAAFLLAVTH